MRVLTSQLRFTRAVSMKHFLTRNVVPTVINYGISAQSSWARIFNYPIVTPVGVVLETVAGVSFPRFVTWSDLYWYYVTKIKQI